MRRPKKIVVGVRCAVCERRYRVETAPDHFCSFINNDGIYICERCETPSDRQTPDFRELKTKTIGFPVVG